MNKDRPPSSGTPDPAQPAIRPDNLWSQRRQRRRQEAALLEERQSTTEYGSGHPRSAPIAILAPAVGIGVIAFLLVAIFGSLFKKPDKAAASPAIAADETPPWAGAVPSEARDGFLEAKTHQERMRWIRSPEQMEPLVAAFYTSGPGSREKVSTYAALPLPPSAGEGRVAEIARYGVLMEDVSKRLLSIVPTPEGARIDFPTYSRQTSAPWPEIIQGKAARAEVRIFVSPGKYHAAPFADSAVWLPVLGGSPDAGGDLLLYVRRGTPECAAIEAALKTAPQRVTITIAPVQESWRDRKFEITAFQAREWLGPSR